MIIGHQKQWQFLKKSAELGKVSPALLFSGQSGLGKKTMALEFAKFLNCQHKDRDKKPCQECKSCLDFQTGRHPDLVLIKPRGREIQISQIKDLHFTLSLSCYSAAWRVVIFDQAHSLNQESQSALLKILEEPKPQTIFILIAEHPRFLLPTILSRLETVKFYPVPRKEIEDYLKSKRVKDIEEILRFALGRPGLALAFAADPSKIAFRKKKEQELERLRCSDLSFRFHYAKELSDNSPELRETLDVWLNYLRQNLFENKRIIKMVQDIQFLISTTNVNSRLALEILMLEL
jgi:DNA polymerase-3 subunit delta'